jgi:hypothetical protein
MANTIKIEKVKLANLTAEQIETHVEWGTFDDNGGETDGNLYLVETSDLIKTDDVEIVDGFKFTGDNAANIAYTNACVWTAIDVVLALDMPKNPQLPKYDAEDSSDCAEAWEAAHIAVYEKLPEGTVFQAWQEGCIMDSDNGAEVAAALGCDIDDVKSNLTQLMNATYESEIESMIDVEFAELAVA